MAAPVVELRPVRPEDKDRLLTWRNSPDVAAYMYSDHQITPAEHDRWFSGIEGDERRAYWIIQMDGQPVGLAEHCALHDIGVQALGKGAPARPLSPAGPDPGG